MQLARRALPSASACQAYSNVATSHLGVKSMRIDQSQVRLDFGQGQSDQALYTKAAAIRKQVSRLVEILQT